LGGAGDILVAGFLRSSNAMLERWASYRSTQRETVPEPRTKWDESKPHDASLSRYAEQRLRAINRAPEIVGKRFGIEYQTAKQAVRVCKAIGSCRRLQQLSFYHHQEVAGRDDKEDPECLALYREAMKEQGRRNDFNDNVIEVKPQEQGNSKAYTCERLKRQAVIRLRRLRSTSRNDGIWHTREPFNLSKQLMRVRKSPQL
jgi:hypothetical protein